MVLWELTLATAYWLGLRRTYRLALKLQRKLIGRRHPSLLDFAHRRTRNVFDVALSVHKEIQKRDLLVGRSVGNYILRFLDRMRPSANIRGSLPTKYEAPARIESETKQADKKPISGTPEAGGRKSEGGTGSDNGMLFASQPPHGSHLGLSIREKVNIGLGRLRPGPGAQSLPGRALGLWWQPVRQSMEFLHMKSSAAAGLPTSVKAPQEYYTWKGSSSPSRRIIREDILNWMQK